MSELWRKEGKSKNTREFGRGILTHNVSGPIFPASPSPTLAASQAG